MNNTHSTTILQIYDFILSQICIVPSILQEAIGVTHQNLEKADEEATMVINKCVTYLNKLYREEEVDQNGRSNNNDGICLVKFTLKLPENIMMDDVNFLRDYLVLHKQEQTYIR